MQTSEKLMRSLEIMENPLAVKLLERAHAALANENRERNRTGNVVYLIAGEFMKEGGSYKSWKSRWFVVNDSGLSYYKDKQEWENGPVAGTYVKPKGVILLSDMKEITTHANPKMCPTIEQRPKGTEQTHCLHVLTQNRTYNIVGFESEQRSQQWLQVLKTSLKLYDLNRRSKNVIRKAKESLPIPGDEEDFLQIRLEKEFQAEFFSLYENREKNEGVDSNREQASSKEATTHTEGNTRPRLEKASSSNSLIQSKKAAPLSKDNKKWGNSFLVTNNTTESNVSNRASPKPIVATEILNSEDELTFEGLGSMLRDVDNKKALKLVKYLLKEFQADGTLTDVILAMIRDDPKSRVVFPFSGLSQ